MWLGYSWCRHLSASAAKRAAAPASSEVGLGGGAATASSGPRTSSAGAMRPLMAACYAPARDRASCHRVDPGPARLGAPVCRADSGAVALRSGDRSEEHTSELQSRLHLVCRLLLEKKKNMSNLHRTYVSFS